LGANASRRDVHVHTVAALGRLGWQEVTGYSRRALVETTMGRYKALIGSRLRARNDAGRRTEAAVGAVVLNRMLAGRTAELRPQYDRRFLSSRGKGSSPCAAFMQQRRDRAFYSLATR
jgi:hypothetical protein